MLKLVIARVCALASDLLCFGLFAGFAIASQTSANGEHTNVDEQLARLPFKHVSDLSAPYKRVVLGYLRGDGDAADRESYRERALKLGFLEYHE